MDFENSIKELNSKFEEQRFKDANKKFDKETASRSEELKSANKERFNLYKNLMILLGTIFGSSIALAAGRELNMRFVFGELFLLVSIISGVMILNSSLKDKYWTWWFLSKMNMNDYLSETKGKIEPFLQKTFEKEIKYHEEELNKINNSFFSKILKLIPEKIWCFLFYFSFIFGILFIWFSVVPFNTKKPECNLIDQKVIESITPIPTDIFYIPSK